MQSLFVYNASFLTVTPASYARSNNLLFYATKDLYIHAVNFVTGKQAWRVKPSVLKPTIHTTFEGITLLLRITQV